MTKKKIKEIKERVEAASKDWTLSGEHDGSYFGDTLICLSNSYEGSDQDVKFIENARADILALLLEIIQSHEDV